MSDLTPLLLDCRIENDHLEVRLVDTLLGSEKYPVPLGTGSIVFSDFEHDGKSCRVNAFTIDDEGMLQPWTRTTDGASLQLRGPDQTYDLHVVLVPVAHAPAGPLSGLILSAFEPESWHTLVHVHVPTDGSRPIPDPEP